MSLFGNADSDIFNSRLAFASIIPFVILAIVASACLRGVKELMTEHVEATVEKIPDKTAMA